MKRTILLTTMFFCFLANLTIAQTFTNYTNVNTAPLNQVNDSYVISIAIDSDGNKWFGTRGLGVTKFDGSSWVTYKTANGLANDTVTSIAIDENGSKWFATRGGVSKFDGNSWTTYTTSDGLLNNIVNSIAIDTLGRKWFCTNSGISVYNDTVWSYFIWGNTNGGLPNFPVNTMVIDANGNEWFGTNYSSSTGCVVKYDNTGHPYSSVGWTKYIQSKPILSIAIDAQGNIWAGTNQGGVLKFNGSTWVTYNTSSGLANNTVNAIAVEANGNMWFGTNGGVSMYNGVNWTTYSNIPAYNSLTTTLAHNTVNCIVIENTNNLWFGTNGRLSKYDGQKWSVFPTYGLKDVSYYSSACDLNDVKWFGSYNTGVAKYDGTTWLTYNTANGLIGNSVRAIVIDGFNNKWFGTTEGVSMFNDSIWTNYPSSSGTTPGIVTCMAVDNQNNIWVGSQNGLYKYDGINWSHFTTQTIFSTSNGVSFQTISGVAIDGMGNIWCTSLYWPSIAKYDGINWVHFDNPYGFNFYSLTIDSSDNKWICFDDGVVKYDGSNWTIYSYSSGSYPFTNGTTSIAIDNFENVWAGGYGIQKFDGISWVAYLNNSSNSDFNTVFSCSVSAQNVKWIASGAGVSEFTLPEDLLPLAPGSISGLSNVCQNQYSVAYTVPQISNATSYLWSLPYGASGSSTTNSIIVDFNSNAISGNISVCGVNSYGQGSTNTLPITVNALPLAAGTISGTETVCQGETSVNYTVPTITNATSYVWTLPSGATGTSTTNSITADFGTSAISGDITVKGTNSCGDGTASTLPITVNIKPTTPIITLNGLVLHSNVPTGNQWFNQNGLINGATNQNYTVTVDGDYYVIVNLLGCSSDPSNTINVTVTGIEVVESGRVIKVYPNPVSNELIIEIEGNNEKVNFDIINAIGQIVFKGNVVDKTNVQTSDFAPGVYLIKLENGKTFEFKKIIKE